MTNIETRLWTLCFSQILINTLLFFLCMHMLNASFPVFIIEKGHDPATGGMMTTAFMLAAIFTRPFVSVFLHRMNMKKIMFITLILLFFCVLMSFNRDLIPLLLLIRVLEGVGFGIITTLLATMTTNIIPHERLGEGVGFFGDGHKLRG